MGMVVRTNTMALNAYRQLGMNNSAVSKSLEKLSSGFRINRAGDDAAGLAISEKMKAQIKGLETASANAQDGISLIQTAEGNLNEVHDMLNRMVELATKSANGTYTQTERDALQDEVDSLLEEIDRISKSANFNGTNLLDGSMGFNSKAFSIDNLTSVPAFDGTVNIKNNFQANSSTESADLHYTVDANTTEVDPKFSIDLEGLEIDVSGATGTQNLGFNIAGATITISLVSTGGASGDGVYNASDIADELVTALKNWDSANGVNSTVANGNDTHKIGDFLFDVSANGSKVQLAFTGIAVSGKAMNANGANATTQTKGFTEDEAKLINAALGEEVGIPASNSANNVIVTNKNVAHFTPEVEYAQAIGDKKLAGITFELDENIVKDGYTMTIGGAASGQTFIFKTDKNSNVTAGSGQILIDVSDVEGDEQIHKAVDKLSQYSTADFKIESKDGTHIHLDQKTTSTKTYGDYDQLTSTDVIDVKGPATSAENSGIKIGVTAGEVNVGDGLVIDGKEYVFTDDAEKLKNADPNSKYVYVDKADPLNNLAAALSTNGLNATVSGNDVLIRVANAGDANPTVTGRGLVLQIGDTADEFNKMSVQIGDMGTKGLNLTGLKITSSELASNAIDRIKTAINSVSTARAGMGALQNRLEHTINNLDVSVENLSAANSRIRDTDMAKEMMNYTKMNVLVQSAQAMLAQANQQPQSVLQLLQ